ncbi:DUF411 domain-containing protein [Halomonas lysinitropha]|uniref:DUF411 domain-containing protein n=1 Tax=Halomonas lysinitropha TaxID=2607506 RepID=A0A5K1I289_9GAMM|nr:DUF411 domain-containing protein [Halomonas lysinitropha]VVZ94083.1 hypothetical protein HALO32_00132 [Halomonas lysinitropha]
MNRFTPTLLFSAALLLGAGTAQAALPAEATLYKNPQCGCCDGYADHLEEMGIEVTVIDDRDLGQIKEASGLPYGLGSCHTIEMGGYVIEGHVPLAAVEKLFEEQPDIDGIGLAGMPIGTPGMPGSQQSPYEVYQFTDRQESDFMTL